MILQIKNLYSWWCHQMETFSALLSLCAGNSPVTGEFPWQRPVTRSFDVFFDLRLNKQLSKQSEAGDLRCHRAHYDFIVMWILESRSDMCDIHILPHSPEAVGFVGACVITYSLGVFYDIFMTNNLSTSIPTLEEHLTVIFDDMNI